MNYTQFNKAVRGLEETYDVNIAFDVEAHYSDVFCVTYTMYCEPINTNISASLQHQSSLNEALDRAFGLIKSACIVFNRKKCATEENKGE